MSDHYCVEWQMQETNARDIGKQLCSSHIWSKLQNPRIIKKLRTNVEAYVEKFLADGLHSKKSKFHLKELQEFLKRE